MDVTEILNGGGGLLDGSQAGGLGNVPSDFRFITCVVGKQWGDLSKIPNFVIGFAREREFELRWLLAMGVATAAVY